MSLIMTLKNNKNSTITTTTNTPTIDNRMDLTSLPVNKCRYWPVNHQWLNTVFNIAMMDKHIILKCVLHFFGNTRCQHREKNPKQNIAKTSNITPIRHWKSHSKDKDIILGVMCRHNFPACSFPLGKIEHPPWCSCEYFPFWQNLQLLFLYSPFACSFLLSSLDIRADILTVIPTDSWGL